MKCIQVFARSCTVLLDEEGTYQARAPRALTLNGVSLGMEERSVASLFNLAPDTEYTLTARWGQDGAEEITFRTLPEVCTLDVRAFGAKGDGAAEDTQALQAAILCCPAGGRVLVPSGRYCTGPLFLKSGITLELARGATLLLHTQRERFPVLPPAVPAANAAGEMLLGQWEGDAMDMFAAFLTGIGVENTAVVGEGVLDGQAQKGDWWHNPKQIRIATRPRMLFLRDCKNVTLQGITVRNSPSWNLHPCRSENVSFLNVRVEAPADSPNTDGFDPESCRGVKVFGTVFSVGDDCIAIKSGKITQGMKYHVPCEDVEIAWSCMLDGHGGVTVGSEMSGGVRHVRIHHCLMRGNDRGLRIKSRRGRGKYAVIDDIRFEHVRMENVKVPLVVNSMYFCDPDGKSDYVQCRQPLPVDDRTPTVGSICYEDVQAEGCTACAAYILGLPERPVTQVTLRNCRFAMAPDARPMTPLMACGVDPCAGEGIVAQYVQRLTLENVTLQGVSGEALQLTAVEKCEGTPLQA